MHRQMIPVVALLLLTVCGSPDLTCSSSTTLDALVMCIRTQMPPSGSNGYVAPTSAQRADWQSVVGQMLQGMCDFAVPPGLSGLVQLRTFTDTGNGHSYCLLMEVRDQNGNGDRRQRIRDVHHLQRGHAPVEPSGCASNR